LLRIKSTNPASAGFVLLIRRGSEPALPANLANLYLLALILYSTAALASASDAASFFAAPGFERRMYDSAQNVHGAIE